MDNPGNFSLDSIDSVTVSGLSSGPKLITGSVTIAANKATFDSGTDFDELAVGEKAMTAPVEFVSVFDPTQRKTGPRIPGGTAFLIPEPKPLESPPPKKKQPAPPRPEWSAVELLAREFTRPENRQFARTTVNRIWYVLLGRGLVHPVDLDHSGNPSSHPKLLELLTDEFIAHDYDLKWLIREIVLSRTWQRSSQLPEGALTPAAHRFAVAIERPLMAEQLLASVLQATENSKHFNMQR